MQFELVKVYVGRCTTFYSVKLDGEDNTLFEKFVSEYEDSYQNELEKISRSIRKMADVTGAREQFFKLNEGVPGDGVCALYDEPDKKLRLYCVRYASVAVILGSGGEKPKDIRALQEDVKLTHENQLVRNISTGITQALKSRQIWWSENGIELLCDEESIIIEF